MPKPPLSHTPSSTPPLDPLAEELLTHDPKSNEYLTGALLGYWGREREADTLAKFQALNAPTSRLLKNPDVIASLKFTGLEAPKTPRSSPIAVFTFEAQEVSSDFYSRASVFTALGTDQSSRATVHSVDLVNKTLRLVWSKARTDDFLPDRVIIDSWVSPAPKPERLAAFARRLLDKKPVNQATLDLLNATPPRFIAGGGPANKVFTSDLHDAASWIEEIDHSYVPVQGPPGAGKTFMGAWLIYCLIKSGRRVGITAMSHAAVDNLLKATVALFEEHLDLPLLRAAKRGSASSSSVLPGVSYLDSNDSLSNHSYNLIAGTTWLFASASVMASPVDTLFIDEAGQLSLADAVVASLAATNVVLLGDPLQLTQVVQAAHPGYSGSSVLGHILGSKPIIEETAGVFLPVSYRMHPSVCSFVSSSFYDSALSSHYSCEAQVSATHQSGIHLLTVAHTNNVTKSPEEVALVIAKIKELLGTPYTNSANLTAPLAKDDFMVIAPFNDQVDLFRQALDLDPATSHIRVGTVDKFQGQEAPVVFYSLVTSSRSLAHRTLGFLFSPNRLNVAVSRARALVFVVASSHLFSDFTGSDPDSDRPLISLMLSLAAYSAKA